MREAPLGEEILLRDKRATTMEKAENLDNCDISIILSVGKGSTSPRMIET